MTVKAYGEMTNSLAMRERERKLVELQSPTAAKATSSFVVAGTSSHVANPFASSAVSSSSANANAVTKPFQQTSSAGLFVAAANVAEGYDVVPLPQAYPKLSGSSAVLLVFGMLLLWFELTLACFSQTDVFTQIRYIAQSMKKTATSATSSAAQLHNSFRVPRGSVGSRSASSFVTIEGTTAAGEDTTTLEAVVQKEASPVPETPLEDGVESAEDTAAAGATGSSKPKHLVKTKTSNLRGAAAASTAAMEQ